MNDINKIQIKRGSGAPGPGVLDVGELGWDTTNKKLYVGNKSSSSTTESILINGSVGVETIEGKAGQLSLTDIGAAPISHNHAASNITSGILPVERGGTGSSDGLMKAPHNAIIKKYINSDGSHQLYYTPTNKGALYVTTEGGAINFGTLPIEQGGTGATKAEEARKNLNVISKCEYVYTSGLDLNDYLTEGWWYFSSDAAPTNTPNTDNKNGFLHVVCYTTSSSRTLLKQFWYRFGSLNTSDHETFLRTYDSTIGWSNWTQIITSTGDQTLNGALVVKGSANMDSFINVNSTDNFPRINLRDADENIASRIQVNDKTHQLGLYQYSPDKSGKREGFHFPQPENMTSSIDYRILTSKTHGMKMLWENPSPNEDYKDTSIISMNLKNYSGVIVYFRNTSGDGGLYLSSSYIPKGHTGTLLYTTSAPKQAYRNFTVSDSGVTFQDAKSSGSVSNTYCIPYYIYGCRGIE